MRWKWLAVILLSGPLVAGDIAEGKRLYDSQCALCHGIGGSGGRGPALTVPELRHARDAAELENIILNGIDGTGMPAFWFLGERPIARLAAYVKSLGLESQSVPPAGNAAHGLAVYQASGCAECHVARGMGSAFGPELNGIGARRSAAFLRTSILDPASAVPEGFLMVRVTPRNGPPVSGVRLNEDSFTIQLQDAGGRFYSFRKQDLADIRKDFGKSPMPSYRGKLSDADLNDLVAWLATLKGME